MENSLPMVIHDNFPFGYELLKRLWEFRHGGTMGLHSAIWEHTSHCK